MSTADSETPVSTEEMNPKEDEGTPKAPEVKENGDHSSAENSAPESAAPAEENPAPECDAEPEKAAADAKEETPADVSELEELFTKLTTTESKSLLKKHLTREILDKLKSRKTALGGTLVDCIRSGCLNPDSNVGLYASDPEAYKTFVELFDPVIKDYNKLPAKKNISHPNVSFGDLDKLEFEDLDPDGKYVVSTRIRVGRAHDGFTFPPTLSAESRKEMESKTVEALNDLEGELKGNYYPLNDMSPETQAQLIADHFLFKDDNKFRRCAGGFNDWPDGRGIFYNENKNFLVWVNEGDHLRIISMQNGGDVGAVYKRLVTGIKTLEGKIKYARDSKLGYVNFCPTNLGNSVRASVHVRIPLVAATDKLKETCEKFHLQARGIHGEHTASEGGVYDISNMRRLGLTELQAVTDMYNGAKELIRLEKDLG